MALGAEGVQTMCNHLPQSNYRFSIGFWGKADTRRHCRKLAGLRVTTLDYEERTYFAASLS